MRHTQGLKYDNVQLFFVRARQRLFQVLVNENYFASSLLSYHNVALLGNVVNESKTLFLLFCESNFNRGGFVSLFRFRWALVPDSQRLTRNFRKQHEHRKTLTLCTNVNRTRKHNGRSFENLLNRKHASELPIAGPRACLIERLKIY